MRLRWHFVASLLIGSVPAASAQQEASPAQPYVLHAYANLVQIPTLALTSRFEPLPGIQREQFSITLDGGPAFRPTRMHIEGDEPISLAVMIDASGSQDRLVRELPQALASLARSSLGPQDHVSIFTLDCRLIRSGLSLPADPGVLQSAVERGLGSPLLHDGKIRGSCGHSLHTWDATASVLQSLSHAPGRRVLLLLSTGDDHKSLYKTDALRLAAVNNSIAIFALRDLVHYEQDYVAGRNQSIVHKVYIALSDPLEAPFADLCESTGGVIITLDKDELQQGLRQFISMLRDRYILEFPRPDTQDGGEHRIGITITNQAAVVFSTGVSVPIADAAIGNDPNTVPSTPSPAVMGKKRPSPPKP